MLNYNNLKSKLAIFLAAFILLGISDIYAQRNPELLFPPDSSGCVPTTNLRLEWSRIQSTTSYTIQIATDENMTNLVINHQSGTASNNYDVPNDTLDYSRRYYWRVGSVLGNDPEDWSVVFEFETYRRPPSLNMPITGAVCQDLNFSVFWSDTQNWEAYRLQVSAQPNFSSFVLDTANLDTNAFAIAVPNYFTTYYWRVQGRDGDCIGNWSEVFEFQTKLGMTSAIFPADSAVGVDIDINFEWSAVAGAVNYDLQISTTDTFGINDLLLDLQDLATTSSLHVIPEVLNKVFYWRVKGKNADCESAWKVFHFKTPYPATELTTPLNEAECVAINATFDWQAVPNALQYRIQIATDNEFSVNSLVLESNGIDTNSRSLQLPGSLTQYFWRVRADDSINIGRWSETRSLRSSVFRPTPVYPLDSTRGVPMIFTFDWDYSTQITNFELQLSFDAEFDSLLVDTLINNPFFTFELPEYNQWYYWRVRTNLGNCSSDWTDVMIFKSVVGFPDLIFPENKQDSVPVVVKFEWTRVEQAVAYDIYISQDSLFVNLNEFSKEGVDATRYDALLAPLTKYYWKVRTRDIWGISPWGETYSFTTGIPDPSRVQLLLPENRKRRVALDEKLIWKPVVSADSYVVQISSDPIFNEITLEERNITDTTFVFERENYETYYWRVAAVNSMNQSSWSTIWSFRTIAPLIEDATVLIAPANGDNQVDYVRVQFNWREMPNTLPYEGGYTFQLSKNEDFSGEFLANDPALYTTVKVMFGVETDVPLYWRVRGFNEAGEGIWSEVRTFTAVNFESVRDLEAVDFGLTASPNPANNDLRINFNVEIGTTASLEIFSNNGALLQTMNFEAQDGDNNININANNLQSGAYNYILRVGHQFQAGNFVIIK